MKKKNKLSLLFDVLRKYDVDVCFLQEVNIEHIQCNPNYNFMTNVGPSERGTGIIYRNTLNISDVLCSQDGRVISATINKYRFINVYAPSGAQNYKERNIFFQDHLVNHFNFKLPVVLLGDFNCIIRKQDSKNNANICHSLKNLVQNLKLKDIWLYKNNGAVGFTYVRENCQSRIDRMYITDEHVELAHSIKNLPVPFSDHNAVLCLLKADKINVPSHGWGFWKLKYSVLENNENNKKFMEIIKTKKNCAKYKNNFVQWWFDIFKPSCKKFYRQIEIDRAVERKNTLNFYNEVLFDLYKSEQSQKNFKTIKEIKNKILQIKEQILEEDFQNNNNDKVAGKFSLYDVIKQRRKKNNFHIDQLLNDTGTIIKGNKNISQYIKNHFKEKFETKKIESKEKRCLLAHIKKKLSAENKTELVDEISREEVLMILKESKTKKCPGMDGIPYEAYLKLWEEIGNDLTHLLNLALKQSHNLTPSFSEGVIILIHKVKNPRTVDQFRPITLLNTDYKLLTKILATRLKNMTENILGQEQNVGADGSIFNGLLINRDIILKMEKNKKMLGAILSLDFKQSFDRVSHQYLWDILTKMDFPEALINLLKTLYKKATSKVLINGYVSESFSVMSSVRQGCPLSMLLFAISIEPLIRLIHFSIQGIKLEQINIKISAYADDVVVYLGNNSDLLRAKNILNIYEKGSGAILNNNKTNIMYIGKWISQNSMDNTFREGEKQKILGVHFCKNIRDTVKENWEVIIKNIQKMLYKDLAKNLDLIRKIWYINIYLLSKVWYTAQVLPMPELYSQKIVKIIGKFLWPGHIFRVGRAQLYLPLAQGGLELQNVSMKTKALFIKTQFRSWSEKGIRYYSCFNNIFESNNQNQFPAVFQKVCVTVDKLKLKKTDMVSTKTIYIDIMKTESVKPAIELKFNNDWPHIWGIFSYRIIPTKWKSALYKAINDIYPTGVKLYNHSLSDNQLCKKCNKENDTIMHRIKDCSEVKNNWNWTKNILEKKFKININRSLTLYDLVNLKGKNKKETELIIWFIAGLVFYNLESKAYYGHDFLQLLISNRFALIKSKIKFSKKMYCF